MLTQASVENQIVFIQDKLYDLVLKDHVHREVIGLVLWSQQRWAEHYCHVLHRHAIVLSVFNNIA